MIVVVSGWKIAMLVLSVCQLWKSTVVVSLSEDGEVGIFRLSEEDVKNERFEVWIVWRSAEMLELSMEIVILKSSREDER